METDDLLGYVLALNVERRHLTETQRGMIAARMVTTKKGSNQHGPHGLSSQGDEQSPELTHESVFGPEPNGAPAIANGEPSGKDGKQDAATNGSKKATTKK